MRNGLAEKIMKNIIKNKLYIEIKEILTKNSDEKEKIEEELLFEEREWNVEGGVLVWERFCGQEKRYVLERGRRRGDF